MKIKVRESKDEARSFDYSEVEEDAKRFDFEGVKARLHRFQGWLEGLQSVVPGVKTPMLRWSSQGSSGFNYRISERLDSPVEFEIECGTNPEKFQEFWGTIYAGGKKFAINSVQDLTDQLIEDIAKAL